jgi:hypothetical protein
LPGHGQFTNTRTQLYIQASQKVYLELPFDDPPIADDNTDLLPERLLELSQVHRVYTRNVAQEESLCPLPPNKKAKNANAVTTTERWSG